MLLPTRYYNRKFYKGDLILFPMPNTDLQPFGKTKEELASFKELSIEQQRIFLSNLKISQGLDFDLEATRQHLTQTQGTLEETLKAFNQLNRKKIKTRKDKDTLYLALKIAPEIAGAGYLQTQLDPIARELGHSFDVAEYAATHKTEAAEYAANKLGQKLKNAYNAFVGEAQEPVFKEEFASKEKIYSQYKNLTEHPRLHLNAHEPKEYLCSDLTSGLLFAATLSLAALHISTYVKTRLHKKQIRNEIQKQLDPLQTRIKNLEERTLLD